jgi:hypothetical protein
MGMLVNVKDWGVSQDKKKRTGAKNRQNPRGKPGCQISTRHWEVNFSFSKTTKIIKPNMHWSYQEDSGCS